MDIRKAILSRFGLIYAIILVFTLYIIVKVFIIQHTSEWGEKGEKMEVKEVPISGRRGDICAEDGSPLATSVPYFELRMDMGAPGLSKIFNHQVDSLSLCLSHFFRDRSAKSYASSLRRAYHSKQRYWLITPRKVNYEDLEKIRKFPILRAGRNSGGLIAEQENKRIYPFGSLAIRTLGKLNKGMVEGDDRPAGAFGLENAFEKELRGEEGIALKQNMSGRWFVISKDDLKDGSNVVTTLDVKMQDQLTWALKQQLDRTHAQYGTAILMEVKTGDIKAIANFGRNSAGELVGGYQNYGIGNAGNSEPGSTFKLVTYMAAMEDGKIDTSTIVDTGKGLWVYKKLPIHDSDYETGGHGKLTAKQAFECSSNVAIAKLITQSYQGQEKDFVKRICKMGMDEKLDIGIKGTGEPYIKKPGDQYWSGVSLAMMSFGYEIKVTPLQTLTFYNAVANNGCMMKPRLVKAITEDGRVRKSFGTERLIWQVASAKTIRKAKTMLEGVVENGTAKALKTSAYKIAGKTGTAQVANRREGYNHGGLKVYQSSFAGYFPADDPKYSCIVVINGPKGGDYYGASVAGPVFRQISDYVYAYELGLKDEIKVKKPKHDPEIPGLTAGRKKDIANVLGELDILNGFAFLHSKWVEAAPDKDGLELNNRKVEEGVVPNVKGMGATDAVYLLEKCGLRVTLNGRGKVKFQSLKAGTKIRRGQSIAIRLS